MLRVDLHKAHPGMALALPVMHPKHPDQQLLRVGYALCPAIIERLIKMGTGSVWVEYPSLAFMSRHIDPEAIRRQGHVVAQVRDSFEQLQRESSARLPYDTYTAAIGSLIDQIVGNPAAAFFMEDLCAHGEDHRLMRHSANVSYLSLLLGLKLEGYLIKQRPRVAPERAKDVTNLGLGAMLHDLGVTLLPEEVVRRYEETGDDTDTAWREHPALGFRATRGKLDPSAAAVLMHHHQRFDGSGYAGKGIEPQQGEAIHIFPRIVAVAEAYNALRHPVHGPERPAVGALCAMLAQDMRDGFDPTVLHALFEVVPPYSPGSLVRLSNGCSAVVIEHRRQDPCRPAVQVLPGDELPDAEAPPGPVTDLSETAMHIIAVEDVQTDRYNFEPETIPGYCAALHGW